MRVKLSRIEGGIYILPFVLIGIDGIVAGFLFYFCVHFLLQVVQNNLNVR